MTSPKKELGFDRAYPGEDETGSQAMVSPEPGARGAIRDGLSALPAIGVALLPKLTCPACWPAYAWILGLFGIGFVNYTPYLAPLMAFFLTLAVAPMAFRAKSRRGYGPFAVGLAAAVVVMGGKFWFDSDYAMNGGLGLLVAALLWNMWPMKKPSCPACAREAGVSK